MSAVMALRDLMRDYRPGSDDWSWDDEARDLHSRDAAALEELRVSLLAEGMREPILLGDDGRIWDGHHRIVAACLAGMRDVPVTKAASA